MGVDLSRVLAVVRVVQELVTVFGNAATWVPCTVLRLGAFSMISSHDVSTAKVAASWLQPVALGDLVSIL